MTRGVMKECPCCGRHMRPGQLLCSFHRRMIPSALLQAVNKAWRAYKAAPLGQPAIAALAVYGNARDAAILAVVRKIELEREAA